MEQFELKTDRKPKLSDNILELKVIFAAINIWSYFYNEFKILLNSLCRGNKKELCVKN
jgi:hypothetical protein